MMSKNLKLLSKEFHLAVHPTSIMFLFLSLMIFIPNYPFYVTFFYTTLGIYFTCLQGRENHDILFSMMLPIKKSDIVKGRFLSVLVLEILQFILAMIVALLRNVFIKLPNEAGMDSNIAFFGLAFLMMGIFNFVFFKNYYKNPNKVGKAFIFGNVYTWIYILLAEGACFIVPFFKNVLDTMDPQNLCIKLVVFVLGLFLFIVLTLLSYKKSVFAFEKQDL